MISTTNYMNAEFREKIRNGCAKHINDIQVFIEEYLGNSFGIMPKGEIDIRLFMLLQDIGVIKMNPTNFEVVRDLRVTTAKARNLIYAAALRRTDETSINDEILELMCSPRVPTEGKDVIIIEIDNPLLADHIKAQLRQWKEGTDATLNANALKLSMNGYNKLLMSLLNLQLAEQSINETGEELYHCYQDVSREEPTESKIQKIITHAYEKYRDNASAISATIALLKYGVSLATIL